MSLLERELKGLTDKQKLIKGVIIRCAMRYKGCGVDASDIKVFASFTFTQEEIEEVFDSLLVQGLIELKPDYKGKPMYFYVKGSLDISRRLYDANSYLKVMIDDFGHSLPKEYLAELQAFIESCK